MRRAGEKFVLHFIGLLKAFICCTQLLVGEIETLVNLPLFFQFNELGLRALFCEELGYEVLDAGMENPIVGRFSIDAMKANPLLLMIPATLSASCAFMMPVATPPNAIIFGSGRVRIAEMARVGLVLNLIGVVVITVMVYTLGMLVFGIEPGVVPDWATAAK